MNIRTILLLSALLVIGLFAAVNWSAMMAPTTLSLLFTSVEAPIGLVMLGLMTLLNILFLTFIVYLQANIMADRRRMMRDLDAQRELANQAEASRFNELRQFLDGAFVNTDNSIKEAANSLSAYIGELEDRLERKLDHR